jgi:hypothetical protein
MARLFSSQTPPPVIHHHSCNLVHSTHAYLLVKMEQIVFRNVGIYTSDAGKLPKRKHTTFRTWQKFEIKKTTHLLLGEKNSDVCDSEGL